jgi:MFS family permease
MAVLGLAICVWTAVEPAPGPDKRRSFLRMMRAVARPRFARGLWLIALSPLLFASLSVLIPLKLGDLGWGATAVGAVFLAGAALEAVAQPLIGRWTDRVGWRVPVRAGLLGAVPALLVLPWADDPWLLVPLVVFGAVVFSASVTPGTALFSRGAQEARVDQAVVFGATNLSWSSGSALGPPLAGLLAGIGGDALSYLVLAGVCGITLFLVRGPVKSS